MAALFIETRCSDLARDSWIQYMQMQMYLGGAGFVEIFRDLQDPIESLPLALEACYSICEDDG